MKNGTSRSSLDLHDLIHSLNREEKNYVKAFTKALYKGESNELIRLFDGYSNINAPQKGNGVLKEMIRKMRKNLSEQLKTKGNKIAKLEFRLYEKTLKGLENYYMDKIPLYGRRKAANRAAILVSKKLYNQAERCLERDDANAKIGVTPVYLEFLRLRAFITLNKGQVSVEDKEKNLESEYQHNFHHILRYLDETLQLYWNVKLFDCANRDNQRWAKKFFKTELGSFLDSIENRATHYKKVLKKFEHQKNQYSISAIPELLNKDFALGHSAKSFFHNTLGAYYGICYQEGEQDAINKALQQDKMGISLYEGDAPKMIRLSLPLDYIAAINNYINILVSQKRYSEFNVEIGKFDSFKAELKSENVWTPYIELSLLSFQFGQLLHYIHTSGDCITYDKEINELTHEFKKHESKIPNHARVYIHFVLGLIQTYKGDYNLALGYLMDILQKRWGPEYGERKDVQYYAALLYLMVEFDKSYYKNKFKNPYANNILENTISFLKDLKRYGKLEKLIITGTRQMFNSKKENIDHEIKEFYDKLLSENIDSEFLVNLNIIAWLESKMQGISFGDKIKQKNGAII